MMSVASCALLYTHAICDMLYGQAYRQRRAQSILSTWTSCAGIFVHRTRSRARRALSQVNIVHTMRMHIASLYRRSIRNILTKNNHLCVCGCTAQMFYLLSRARACAAMSCILCTHDHIATCARAHHRYSIRASSCRAVCFCAASPERSVLVEIN